jgi:hypothetical protein
MDPYAHAAFGRIQLFLADLNHVFQCLPIRPSGGHLHPFDRVGPKTSLRPDVSNTTVCRGHPTRWSKSWRKKHPQHVVHQPRQSGHNRLPVYLSRQRVAPILNDSTISKTEIQPVIPSDVQPDNQAAPIFSLNSVPIQIDAHDLTNQCSSNYNKPLDEDAADPTSPHLLENKHNAKDQQDPHLLENEHNAKDQYNPHLLEDKQKPDDPQV